MVFSHWIRGQDEEQTKELTAYERLSSSVVFAYREHPFFGVAREFVPQREAVVAPACWPSVYGVFGKSDSNDVIPVQETQRPVDSLIRMIDMSRLHPRSEVKLSSPISHLIVSPVTGSIQASIGVETQEIDPLGGAGLRDFSPTTSIKSSSKNLRVDDEFDSESDISIPSLESIPVSEDYWSLPISHGVVKVFTDFANFDASVVHLDEHGQPLDVKWWCDVNQTSYGRLLSHDPFDDSDSDDDSVRSDSTSVNESDSYKGPEGKLEMSSEDEESSIKKINLGKLFSSARRTSSVDFPIRGSRDIEDLFTGRDAIIAPSILGNTRPDGPAGLPEYSEDEEDKWIAQVKRRKLAPRSLSSLSGDSEGTSSFNSYGSGFTPKTPPYIVPAVRRSMRPEMDLRGVKRCG